MHIGARCTAPCPQDVFTSGSGYVAECTLSGWQVISRDCSMSQPDVCNDLPTPGPPSGSKGWSSSCAGRSVGESCWSECDVEHSYAGSGYVAECTLSGWQVIARSCHYVPHPDVCKDLPAPNAPDDSQGWSPSSAGQSAGASCRAECDVEHYYSGGGYTATCITGSPAEDGHWEVQLGGGCQSELDMLCIAIMLFH